MAPKRSRCRRWCFTAFHGIDDHAAVREWFEARTGEEGPFRYAVAQFETCPDSGREHLQAYCETHYQVSLKTIKETLAPLLGQVHLESARGTPKEASDYCKKAQDGASDAFEFGEFKEQGQRSDLAEVTQQITDGSITRLRDIPPSLYVRMDRGLEKLVNLHAKPRDLGCLPTVIWRYGPTGSGKSQSTHTELKHVDHYKYSPDQMGWFDGYDGHKTVWIEEFRASEFKLATLFNMLDGYECRLKVKGSFIQLQADTFHINSPVHPREVYQNAFKGDEGKDAQLARRITKIYQHRHGEEPREVDWDFVDWNQAV